MKWFSNLNIKSKMIIGFALIIAMVTAMAMFGINRLNMVTAIYNNTIKYPIGAKSAILKTQVNYRDLRRITNTMITYAPLGESARIDRLYQDALSAHESAIINVQEFEDLIKTSPLMNESERETRLERANVLKFYIERYINEVCDPIMNAARIGDYSRCMEIAGNLEAFVDKVRALTVELYELASIEEERSSHNASVTAGQSKVLLAAISAVSVLISVILAMLVASFVTNAFRTQELTQLTVSAMFESNPHVNILFDDSFKLIDCNPEAVKFMGFNTREELLNGFVDLVYRTLPPVLSNGQKPQSLRQRLMTAAVESMVKFEMELHFESGIRRLSVDFKRIPYKDSFAVVGYLFDMTEIFQRETQLARARELNELQLAKLNLVVQASKIGLWDMEVVQDDPVNPSNTFVWSDEFRRMLGYTGENDFPNLLSSWSDLLHPEDKERTLDAFVKHMLDKTGKTPYDVEYRLLRKTGEYAYYRASGECIRDEEGNPIRVAGALMDITDTKNMLLDKERQKEAAEAASRAKTTFLATMSHEMRTPMNAIIGMTTIGKSAPNIERKDYCFMKIEGASNHLLGVINDILDMSKIEANKFELAPAEFELEKMLKGVLNVVNFPLEEKKQELSVDIDHSIHGTLIGDDQRIAQVITNLLGNAVKFTPEHGAISLSVRLAEEADNLCTLRISVSDTGIGISPKQQTKVFQSFEQEESSTTRKYGGSGLGLAISKNIVEMMGGSIWVQSEPGKGSTFTFTVQVARGKEEKQKHSADVINESPGVEKQAALVETRMADSNGLFAGRHILLAEDVEINREIVQALLEPTQLAIDYAENGAKAVRMFTEDPVKYDMIFMDIQMPEMDGYEATRRIRSLDNPKAKTIPIIAMTANVFREDVEKCLASGMNNHVGKPLDLEEVMNSLRSYLPFRHLQ
jgi:PAS domain S-box-containing protein